MSASAENTTNTSETTQPVANDTSNPLASPVPVLEQPVNVNTTEDSPSAAPAPITPNSSKQTPAIIPPIAPVITYPPNMGSLYVGDLHPEVTEADIYHVFQQFGAITSIRVCRDVVTQRSLGYAYVNFARYEDADRALDTMNFDLLKNRPMRIMWSNRDPTLRKNGVGNIFIKNLDKQIDNKALYDTFSAFGNILSCKIAFDESGKSKGYGFVHFETQDAADNAIERVNGMLLNNQKVFVGPFIPRRERQGHVNESTFTNCFVKNLPPSVDDEKLRELFAPFGALTSVKVMVGDDGKSKGFGFVDYKEHDSAVAAVRAMNEHEIDSRRIFVARAQKRRERELFLREVFQKTRMERALKFRGANLYVKNLEDDVDDEQLRTQFSRFGTIISSRVMRDVHGRSRCFGFVCFDSADAASQAQKEMQSKKMGNKPLYVSIAQTKAERTSKLTQYFSNRAMAFRSQLIPGANGQIFPSALPWFPANGFPAMPPPFAAAPGAAGHPAAIHRFPMAPPTLPPSLTALQQLPFSHPSAAAATFQQFLAAQQAALPFQLRGAPRLPVSLANAGGAYLANGGLGVGVRMNQQNAQPSALPSRTPGGKTIVASQPVAPATRHAMGTNLQAASYTTDAPKDTALNPQLLAQAPPAEQKQLLGERLYPLITRYYPQLSGKITGMLLEMDNTELLHMLDTPEVLKAKCDEAYDVLAKHTGALQVATQQQQQAATGTGAASVAPPRL